MFLIWVINMYLLCTFSDNQPSHYHKHLLVLDSKSIQVPVGLMSPCMIEAHEPLYKHGTHIYTTTYLSVWAQVRSWDLERHMELGQLAHLLSQGIGLPDQCISFDHFFPQLDQALLEHHFSVEQRDIHRLTLLAASDSSDCNGSDIFQTTNNKSRLLGVQLHENLEEKTKLDFSRSKYMKE